MSAIEYATWGTPVVSVSYGAPPSHEAKQAGANQAGAFIDIDKVLSLPAIAPFVDFERIYEREKKPENDKKEREKWKKAHIIPKSKDVVTISRWGLEVPIFAVQRGVHKKYATLVKYQEIMSTKKSMTCSEMAKTLTAMFKELDAQGEFKNFRPCEHGDNAKYIGTKDGYDQYEKSCLQKVPPPEADNEIVWFTEIDNRWKPTWEAEKISIANSRAKMVFKGMRAENGTIDMAFGDHYWTNWSGNMVLTVCDFPGGLKKVEEMMDLIAGFYEMTVLDVYY